MEETSPLVGRIVFTKEMSSTESLALNGTTEAPYNGEESENRKSGLRDFKDWKG